MNHEPEQFDQLPDAIVKRLRTRERAVSILRPDIDRAIIDAAKAQFASRQSHPALRRQWAYPAAAAAVALLAVLITQPFTTNDFELLADDVDGSGRVDILDAFALARARTGDPAVVSQSRIDELTARIVSLGDEEALL